MDDERAARLLAASEGECGYDHTGGAVLLAAPMASLLIGALLAHYDQHAQVTEQAACRGQAGAKGAKGALCLVPLPS